jgi:hypothetical protein
MPDRRNDRFSPSLKGRGRIAVSCFAFAALLLSLTTSAWADTPLPWRDANRRAVQASRARQFATAEQLALDALRTCPAANPEAMLCASASLHNAADAALGLGHPDQAEDRLRRALAIRREALPQAHPLIADAELRLGILMQQQNRPAEAEPLFSDAAAIVRPAGLQAVDTLLVILSRLENAQAALGQTDAAVTTATEAQDLATQAHGAASNAALFAASNRITLLRRADKSDMALKVALAALHAPGIEAVVPHWRLLLAGQAAQVAHDVGRPDPARSIAVATLPLADAPDADAPATVTLLIGLDRLALAAGENTAAVGYAERAVALAQAGDTGDLGLTLLERGLARAASGDAAGALPDLDAALPALPGPENLPDRVRAISAAVRACTALGDLAGAMTRIEAALTAEAAAPPATQGELQSYLATTYQALGDQARAAMAQARAITLLESASGNRAGNTNGGTAGNTSGYTGALIAAYRTLAVMRLDLNDVPGALAAVQHGVDLAGGSAGVTPAIAAQRPSALAVAALVAGHALLVPQGLDWARQATALLDAMQSDAQQSVAIGTLAEFYTDIALTPADGARAAALADRARAAYAAIGLRGRYLAAATRWLGQARIWQQRPTEGETLCREAEAQYRALQGVLALELARTAWCIGRAQYAQDRFADAAKTLEAAMTELQDQPRADPNVMAELADLRGLALRDLGQLDEARSALLAAREEALAARAGGSVAYAELLASLGSVLRRTDDIDAAHAIDAEGLALLDRIGAGGGDTGLIRSVLLQNEGLIAQGRGHADAATPLLDEAARLRRERLP